MRPEARCAFEDEEKKIFCPIAQEKIPPDFEICDLCLKANTKKGPDLTIEEFLKLHHDLNHVLVAKLLQQRLEKEKELPQGIACDPTPLKSIHQRWVDLPPPAQVEIIAGLRRISRKRTKSPGL